MIPFLMKCKFVSCNLYINISKCDKLTNTMLFMGLDVKNNFKISAILIKNQTFIDFVILN